MTLPELAVIQMTVEVAFFSSSSWIPLLNDLTVFHDEDQRSVADRGQTVGNDKLVLPLHQVVKRLLNLQFGTGIDA